MATITPTVPSIVGAVTAFAATAVSGDEVAYGAGQDLLVEFRNTHSSSITITVAPTRTSGAAPGGGPVTIPSRSIALAAAADAVFVFKSSEVDAYINANGRIPFTYTSGNILLLIRAQNV